MIPKFKYNSPDWSEVREAIWYLSKGGQEVYSAHAQCRLGLGSFINRPSVGGVSVGRVELGV